MFNRSVTFVVGAGASFEYGMPLGQDLATKIADETDFCFSGMTSRPTKGDPELFETLLRKFQRDSDTLNRYTAAGHKLSAAISSSISIDDALYQLSDYPEAVRLGKLCIIRAIQQAEAGSELKIRPEKGMLDSDAGRKGWVEQMFSMAIAGFKLSELKHAFKRISFVNFNYDRCLEHYLFWSLQRLGLAEQDAAEIVGDLTIIRPYGTAGSIIPGSPTYLPFGDRIQLDPFGIIDRIRTYTESEVLHDKEQLQRILTDASMCIFLGFGFHQQNMDLLSLPKTLGVRDTSRVLATVYKVHPANLPELRTAMTNHLRVYGEGIELLSMTAPEILQQLRLKIMMALG
jgi:hypothetical protein